MTVDQEVQGENVDVVDDQNVVDEESETNPDTESEQSENTEDNEGQQGEEDGELSLTIDGQEQEIKKEKAPSWVKELRKSQRELAKENQQLKKQLETKDITEQKPSELGKKPTLEDFDFDSDEYESALSEWYVKKNQVDAEKRKVAASQEAEQKAWGEKLEAFEASKSDLPFDDYDEVESAVSEALTPEQQAIIIQGSDNAPLIVYAAGKDKSRLEKLANIKDPIKFAFELGKLESKTTMSRKRPVAPERKIETSGSSSDTTLDKLREEARKTGDHSKVAAYKRKLKSMK